MLEDRAASAVAVAFKQHLAALNSEFERLVMENVDLRKQLVSGNEMPSVLSPACSPSSPCSPTQAPAVSSFPGVLEGKETLWQIRSLEACSLKLSTKVTKSFDRLLEDLVCWKRHAFVFDFSPEDTNTIHCVALK